MTAGSSIDYDALTQDALRGMVRTVLAQVAKNGLPGDHHFYVAFNTQAPGVVMSRRLKEKYPDEMMIVLQHRFWDLAVTEEAFEVKLSFDSIPERLHIPFEALKVFFDPSVRFTLQFGDANGNEDGEVGSRRQGDARRGRNRPQRTRNDTSAESPPQPSQPQPAPQPAPVPTPPTVLAPRPVETPRPVAMPNTPAVSDAPARQGGAKVVSLDQFRKK